MSGSGPTQRQERAGSWRAVGRRLWQPPADVRDRRQRERRVEFLELFFDLVFVVLVAQLAHRLAEHPSWSGVGWFAFLFLAVWSSWITGTFYHDAHGTSDLSIRVFTFAQMLTVAFMAVFASDVPGDGATGFALAYAANSGLLAVIWLRAGYYDAAHRPNTYPFARAYAAGTGLVTLSAVVGDPALYWLWGVALVIQTAGAIPAIRHWRLDVEGALATPSLTERLGLLVIIVLGEVVASAINGTAVHEPVDAEVVVGFLGIMVAIGLWWLYFDFVAHRRPRLVWQFPWMYLHFPLVLGVAATGAGVLRLIEDVGEPHSSSGRWLLLGAVALVVAATLALIQTLEERQRHPGPYRAAAIVAGISIVLMVLLGTTALDALATLAVLNALLLAPVALKISVWVKTVDADAIED